MNNESTTSGLPIRCSPNREIVDKKRVEFFDLAKGICIFLVVLYHVAKYYGIVLPANNCIKSIRLPLYFFLSGCFFKTYGGFVDFMKRKTNKLLIPFVFWLLFALVLSLILSCFGIELYPSYTCYRLTLNDFLRNSIHGTFPNTPIWFLLCLFWVNLIFYAISIFCGHIKEKHRLIAVGFFSILAGLTGVILSVYGIRLPLHIDSALTAMPFFAFGYFVFRYTSIVKPCKMDKWIPLIIIVLFSILYVISPFYSLRNNTNINYHNFVMVYLSGFIGALGVILLSKMLNRVPVVSYWGRYSIMILVSHSMVYRLIPVFVLEKAASHYVINNNLLFFANLVLTMAVCTLLIPLFKKYMPHVTAQMDIIPVGDKKANR